MQNFIRDAHLGHAPDDLYINHSHQLLWIGIVAERIAVEHGVKVTRLKALFQQETEVSRIVSPV